MNGQVSLRQGCVAGDDLAAQALPVQPALTGDDGQMTHDFLYWEFPAYQGQQALRMGKWKAVRKNIFKGNMKSELYDLESDLVESRDVAEEHPDIVRAIEKILLEEHEPAHIERFRIEQLGD